MSTNQERIARVVAELVDETEANITADKSFVTDLRCDSLDMVEITMNIEDEFGIEIPDEDVPPIKTVGDLYAYIDNRLAVTTASA